MLDVRVCNVHRTVYEGAAEAVELPTATGELTVLMFHAPMVCALSEGHIVVGSEQIPVRSGVARVDANRIWIWMEEPCTA